MKFSDRHKQAVALALQDTQAPHSLVSRISTLVEKLINLGEGAEARIEQFLNSFAKDKPKTDGKAS